MTYALLVRSEGGRISCDFNGLPRWAKKLGAFPAYKYLSRRTPKLAPSQGSPSLAPRASATGPLIGAVI
jgi:hypothetical protein